jgi:aspartyl-tRNA synthetase
MKMQAAVGAAFREFFESKGWVEVHSPKIIAGSSEGGAEIFKVNYFGQEASLAQSPQLYKQMCIAADFPGVWEIGAVFRAEKSFTNRHLCEFTGVDFEVPFHNHYFEVLDVIGELFAFVFRTLKERHAETIAVVQEQYPHEPFQMNEGEAVKLEFTEACAMLAEVGVEQNPKKDFSAESEHALGKLVKERFATDFFIVYNYPEDARPFYSMPNPTKPGYTNSYDVFMCGEEILSGAQRVHDPELLIERAKFKDMDPEALTDYINAFRLGCPPHAGGGIGLERVTKLFLGIHNIRKVTLFPRDPKRLTP